MQPAYKNSYLEHIIHSITRNGGNHMGNKALDYTEKYDDKMVHSIVLSNMSDAYYLIGAYERAV